MHKYYKEIEYSHYNSILHWRYAYVVYKYIVILIIILYIRNNNINDIILCYVITYDHVFI